MALKKILIAGTLSIGIVAVLGSGEAEARNLRMIVKNKSGPASNSWIMGGIRKFMRGYAGKFSYKIVGGSEASWRKYQGKKDVRVTKVTYNINGYKRNVAYVWAFSMGNTILAVVANKSYRQQSLDRDIATLLHKVK